MSGEVQAEDSASYAIRKHWAFRVLVVVLPLIVSSVLTYTGATGVSKEESAVVKDKAEAGYQFTYQGVETLRIETRKLEARIVRLDAELAALKAAASRKRSPRIRVAPPLATVPPASRPPAPLPPNLDKALERVQATSPAAETTRP